MGGYIIKGGQKLQTDDYIAHLEADVERMERILACIVEKAQGDEPSTLRGYVLGITIPLRARGRLKTTASSSLRPSTEDS